MSFANVFDAISANSEARAVGILFFWSEVYHDTAIGNVTPTVCGHILFVDEKIFVCASDLPWHTLSEPSNFFGVRVSVEVAIFRLFHKVPVFH